MITCGNTPSPQHDQKQQNENVWLFCCVKVLIDWINSELEEDRIIVKDLEEDCYDGQVLQKLFGEERLVSLASQLFIPKPLSSINI